MTRYALQHIGTQNFLAVCPSLVQPPVTPFTVVVQPVDAASYPTMTEAEWERLSLGEFASAWRVVPVEIPSIYDDPQETAPPRTP